MDSTVYVITSDQERFSQRTEGILRLRRFFGRMVLVTKTGTIEDEEHLVVGAYPNPTGVLRLVGLHRLKATLDRYFFFPSRDILYVRPAKKKLRSVIRHDLRKGRKVCVLICVPPHDLSLIGLSLKTEFPQIRWLVDWRDLWSYDVYYFEQVPKIFRNRLLDLERKILANCDVVVTTNIKAKRIIEKLYKVSPERAISINHCFYRPDFDGSTETGNPLSSCRRNGLIKIGFLGNLFKPPKVPGSRVVEAIEYAIGSGFDVKLNIFGDISELAKKAVTESRNNAVVLHPWTTHKESLKKISKCDFLLLALSDLPNCDLIMHGKLPHYLMLGKPILAMVPETSAVADIIKETNSGYVIPTSSNWGAELAKILRDYSNEGKIPKRNETAIEKYSWDNVSRKWLEVISHVS